ncbi:MAG: fasciclin domain-containing protein [Planctomycetaceae bacterium]
MLVPIHKVFAPALCFAFFCVTTIQAAPKDIVTTAVENGSFKTLAAALQAADLVSTLQGEGPFTVFAPTDDAFAKLPKGTIDTLLKSENKDKLTAILTYHVVPGKVSSQQVVGLSGSVTVNGQQVDIKAKDGAVAVDGANVVKTDIDCTNGIIHVIDSVILPAEQTVVETAAAAGSFKTLCAAIEAAGLVETLNSEGPFTVFAPTDEAFANLPEGTLDSLLKPENKNKLISILKYHVVAGRVYSSQAVEAGEAPTLLGPELMIKVVNGKAMVNKASLVKTDIDSINGVIHVIDSVLIPAEDSTAQAHPAAKVIENAVATGSSYYNNGHHFACAQLYDQTASKVLAMKPSVLSPETHHSVETTLHQTRAMSCMTTRAVTLRQALDLAYREVR